MCDCGDADTSLLTMLGIGRSHKEVRNMVRKLRVCATRIASLAIWWLLLLRRQRCQDYRLSSRVAFGISSKTYFHRFFAKMNIKQHSSRSAPRRLRLHAFIQPSQHPSADAHVLTPTRQRNLMGKARRHEATSQRHCRQHVSCWSDPVDDHS